MLSFKKIDPSSRNAPLRTEVVTAEPCLSGILMKSGKQWQSLRMDSRRQVTEEEGEKKRERRGLKLGGSCDTSPG